MKRECLRVRLWLRKGPLSPFVPSSGYLLSPRGLGTAPRPTAPPRQVRPETSPAGRRLAGLRSLQGNGDSPLGQWRPLGLCSLGIGEIQEAVCPFVSLKLLPTVVSCLGRRGTGPFRRRRNSSWKPVDRRGFLSAEGTGSRSPGQPGRP